MVVLQEDAHETASSAQILLTAEASAERVSTGAIPALSGALQPGLVGGFWADDDDDDAGMWGSWGDVVAAGIAAEEASQANSPDVRFFPKLPEANHARVIKVCVCFLQGRNEHHKIMICPGYSRNSPVAQSSTFTKILNLCTQVCLGKSMGNCLWRRNYVYPSCILFSSNNEKAVEQGVVNSMHAGGAGDDERRRAQARGRGCCTSLPRDVSVTYACAAVARRRKQRCH